jgi:hypothetical protein
MVKIPSVPIPAPLCPINADIPFVGLDPLTLLSRAH